MNPIHSQSKKIKSNGQKLFPKKTKMGCPKNGEMGKEMGNWGRCGWLITAIPQKRKAAESVF